MMSVSFSKHLTDFSLSSIHNASQNNRPPTFLRGIVLLKLRYSCEADMSPMAVLASVEHSYNSNTVFSSTTVYLALL